MPNDSTESTPPASTLGAIRLVVGDTPAVRRKQFLTSYRHVASSVCGSDAWRTAAAGPRTLGPLLWIAPSALGAAETRRQLLDAKTPALLQPGIRTLRHAADALASMANQTWHPLSQPQQRWIVNQIAEEGKHATSLGPLAELAQARGLVDLLTRRFDHLRYLGLTPDAVADRLRRSEGKVGNAIGRLYQRYCERLDRSRLLDTAGRLELACSEAEQPGLGLEALVIDAPPPNTPLEARFVSALVAGAKETRISVAGRPSEDLSELSDAPQWLALFPNGQIEKIPAEPATSPALQVVRAHLLDEEISEQAEPEDSVEVVVGSSEQDALRRVAKRVKRLLVDRRATPSQIVITAGQFPRHAASIECVLREYGIPVSIESHTPLGRSPWLLAVRQVLRVTQSDWEMAPLLALLGRRELTQISGNERAQAERFVRTQGLPSGKQYLLHQAESLAGRVGKADAPRLAPTASDALGPFHVISDMQSALPEEAGPLAWFDALVEAVAWLGYRLPHDSPEVSSRLDRAARDTLESTFADLETLAVWRDAKQPRLSLQQVERLVTDWSERLTLSLPSDSEGQVRVVTPQTAVALEAEHLFLAGLDESSFADMAEDLAAEDNALLRQTNRVLFRELTARPNRSLTLAYAALDGKAQPLHPSPYVTEVERLFPENALRREPALLRVVDLESAPCSPREQRLRALGKAAEGDSSPLATLLAHADTTSAAALAGTLAVVHQRSHGDAFGLAEGLLGEQSASLLAERFGSEHLWSASKLETYAECPFKFFAKYAISAEPLEGSRFAVDYRRRGLLLHDAMAQMHESLRKELGAGDRLSDAGAEDLVTRMRDAIRAVSQAKGLPLHEVALDAIEQCQASAWADHYPEQIAKFEGDPRWNRLDEPLKPRYFEARFGPSRGHDDDEVEDEVSTDEPFAWDLPNGERLLLAGKIDRIDIGRVGDQTVFGIVDYKTGSAVSAKHEDIQAGRQLQLALYTLAAEKLFFDGALALANGYWAIAKKGFVDTKKCSPATIDEGVVTPNPAWVELIESVRQRVGQIVQGVRHGDFPMHNPDLKCGTHCDYRTVCRVGQARSLGKTWPAEPESGDDEVSS